MAWLTRLILLFLLLLLVGRAVWRLLLGIAEGAGGRGGGRNSPDRRVEMARDPVCGTFVVPSRALTVAERGRVEYFCSERCRKQYVERKAG